LRPVALVAGATGFIGGRLAGALLDAGYEVRCLVRRPERAQALVVLGCEVRQGDVTDADSLVGAGRGADVAYYLVHAMAGGAGYHEREQDGATNFARMAADEGVARVVYLGGLGDANVSAHLRSRHETALALERNGPPLTYFRAAMVVGAGSESYRTLRYLVPRLPVMIAPAWLRAPTQPIAVDDAIAYLVQAAAPDAASGLEVQIGGPDVLSYGRMLDRMALALGMNPRPKIPVPLITPWLSALWLGLVTPVDTNVARPLVEGLRTATVVTDPVPAHGFAVEPIGFDAALRRALAEEELSEAAA
jgi:uncharacterized protein YbjT (DUF2867 family)